MSRISMEEPPLNVVQSLLQAFHPHAEELGFFLNWSRFRQSIASSMPPLPVLKMSVYLWGANLSGSDSLTTDEANFLASALRHAMSPPGQQLHHVIQLIQASVLISTYFFRQNRVMEGQYHAGTAVSLSMAVGLHKIRSSNANSATFVAGVVHPPPVDQIEEGERIRAFWAVFFLSTCWSVSSELVSAITSDNGMQVDTPWPLDMMQYERVSPPHILSDAH
ncbi:hypothetical protein BD626DRAFT_469677 [Schizophyllum amplum]|uniref:Xylanolytic transcriptional activator regulatory domain-containing protein n=1 Tax=Schizophyllum amplum TaxID=97359 RepID=A0A550BS78_9AGAR|nr:hypothetical protein BD626DRAFT_469677 [Auriculariopsis ampla]